MSRIATKAYASWLLKLGQHRAVGARDQQRAVVGDSSMWVCATSAQSLGMLGNADVANDLELLLQRYDGPDPDAALEVLQMLTGVNYNLIDRQALDETTYLFGDVTW